MAIIPSLEDSNISPIKQGTLVYIELRQIQRKGIIPTKIEVNPQSNCSLGFRWDLRASNRKWLKHSHG